MKQESSSEFHCFYDCESNFPSTQIYDVLPQSASELAITLPIGTVCDKCNSYFGRKLENHFCHNHPGVTFKTFGVKRTGNSKIPKTFLQHGEMTGTDLPNYQRQISIPLPDLKMERVEGKGLFFKSYLLPKPFQSRIISRVLAKMALETLTLCIEAPSYFSSDGVREYKKYIRQGQGKYIPFCYSFHEVPFTQRTPHFEITYNDFKILGGCANIYFPKVKYQIPIPPVSPKGYFIRTNEYIGYICDEDRTYEGTQVPIGLAYLNE